MPPAGNALARAAASGNGAELHALLLETPPSSSSLGVAVESGLTPLHAAIYAGSVACAQLLVGAKADINAAEANGGASRGHFGLVRCS